MTCVGFLFGAPPSPPPPAHADDDVKIFASIRERKFTDIWFLCFGFFPYLIGMITIGSLSLANGNVNILLYPRDYKGQFCGGTSDVASMTKAYYPRLDKDLSEQMDILRSPTSFFNFQPYTLCVSECPEAYSLRDPEPFGGSTYPGADPGDRQFYAILGTREIFSRCLPVTGAHSHHWHPRHPCKHVRPPTLLANSRNSCRRRLRELTVRASSLCS